MTLPTAKPRTLDARHDEADGDTICHCGHTASNHFYRGGCGAWTCHCNGFDAAQADLRPLLRESISQARRKREQACQTEGCPRCAGVCPREPETYRMHIVRNPAYFATLYRGDLAIACTRDPKHAEGILHGVRAVLLLEKAVDVQVTYEAHEMKEER